MTESLRVRLIDSDQRLPPPRQRPRREVLEQMRRGGPWCDQSGKQLRCAPIFQPKHKTNDEQSKDDRTQTNPEGNGAQMTVLQETDDPEYREAASENRKRAR